MRHLVILTYTSLGGSHVELFNNPSTVMLVMLLACRSKYVDGRKCSKHCKSVQRLCFINNCYRLYDIDDKN